MFFFLNLYTYVTRLLYNLLFLHKIDIKARRDPSSIKKKFLISTMWRFSLRNFIIIFSGYMTFFLWRCTVSIENILCVLKMHFEAMNSILHAFMMKFQKKRAWLCILNLSGIIKFWLKNKENSIKKKWSKT